MRALFISLVSISLLAGCAGVQLVQPAGACVIGGRAYTFGTTGIPAPDECNTCTCTSGSRVVCTQLACTPGDAPLAPPPSEPASALPPVVAVSPSTTSPSPSMKGIALTQSGDMTSRADARTFPLTYTPMGSGALVAAQTGERVTWSATMNDLPALNEGDRYTAWLVRVEPFDARRLGDLAAVVDSASFTLSAETATTSIGYERFVITRETQAGAAFDGTRRMVEVLLTK